MVTGTENKMECKCGSGRIATVEARCKDGCFFRVGDESREGYAPAGVNIGKGYGDYVEFNYCLDCGRIQGEFPVTSEDVKIALERMT